jgi:hypothetical protein
MYFLSGSVRGGNCSGSFRGNVITVMLSRFSVEEELSLDKFDNSEELEELEELFGVFRLFFQLWTVFFLTLFNHTRRGSTISTSRFHRSFSYCIFFLSSLLEEAGGFDVFDNASDQHSVSVTFEDSFALSGHGLYGALSSGAGSSLTGDAEEFSFFHAPVIFLLCGGVAGL